MPNYGKFQVIGGKAWSVNDDGIYYGTQLIPFESIEELKLTSKPSILSNGLIQLSVDGKKIILGFYNKQAKEGMSAYDFISQHLIACDTESGVPDTIIAGIEIYQPETIKEVLKIAAQHIPNNEKIIVALKGAFKEYLICTDKVVYIIKSGFMTGHLTGSNDFKMAYRNITNAEVDFHFTSGYFELSYGGLQNKNLKYWSSDDSNNPAKQPNAISIVSQELAEQFKKAATLIMQKADEDQKQNTVIVQAPATGDKSMKEQLKDLKDLLDEGIITQEEFDAKKKQILGL